MVEDEECKKCIEIVRDMQNELVCKIKTNYNDKMLKLTQELYESKKDFESCKITKNHLLELFEIQSKRIAELEEQLKNAIVLPKELQVGNKVYFIDIEEKYIHKGKIYSITKELNYEENGFIIWVYCRYDDGLTYTHPIEDYGVELFATKEEAQAKLEELKGEKYE